MRICLILNPNAGSAEDADVITTACRGRCAVHMTAQPGDATRLARSAVEDGFTRIIAAGGDGTIFEVVNGVAPRFDAVEFAVLPMGTGNDLARTLSLPLRETNAALQLALTGDAFPIDVIRFTMNGDPEGRYFLNVATGGISEMIETRIDKERKARWGSLAYFAAFAAEARRLPQYDVKLSRDDHAIEARVFSLAVANGRRVAGGFPVAPQALLDDGEIEIVMAPVQPLTDAALAAAKLLLGQSEDAEEIISIRDSAIHIESDPEMGFNADGEQVGRTPARFEVLPRALRTVVAPECMALRERTDSAAETAAGD